MNFPSLEVFKQSIWGSSSGFQSCFDYAPCYNISLTLSLINTCRLHETIFIIDSYILQYFLEYICIAYMSLIPDIFYFSIIFIF